MHSQYFWIVSQLPIVPATTSIRMSQWHIGTTRAITRSHPLADIAEKQCVFGLVDERDNRARLDVRAQDLAGLSADQRRAVATIAASPFLVQPLRAPAGAGKTHSLKALRAAAHHARKEG